MYYSLSTESAQVPLISYGYVKNLSTIDKALCNLALMVGLIFFVYIVIKFELICGVIKKFGTGLCKDAKNVKSLSIFTSIITVWSLSISGLELHKSLVSMPVIFAFLSANWLENHIVDTKELLNTKRKRIAVVILTLIAAFALAGNRCFIYPLNMHVTPEASSVFFSHPRGLPPL